MSLKRKKRPPTVIFDTNIFGYLADGSKVNQISDIISEVSSEFEISISLVTFYELIRFGTKKIKGVLETISKFKSFEIDKEVLTFAAIMYCLGIKKDGDSIIAATALLNNTYIFTADSADFSEPYFHETRFWLLSFKNSKNRTQTVTLYLLEVDLNEIEKAMEKIEIFT